MSLTARTVRRTAVAALACAALAAPAIALAAPNSPARTSNEAAARAATPLCQTPGLVIWFNPNGSGTLGSTFFHLRFTNLSGHSCTLNGFPFMYAVNLSGHKVGHIATFSGTPHQVTLGNGKTAHAVLQVVDAFNFPFAACHPVTAAGFTVFPPNQTRAKLVPFPVFVCAKTGPVILTVRPVVLGF